MCRNCAFHAPGAHHDCREPAADPVRDPERANFCEYFVLASSGAPLAAGEGSHGARAALDALFRK